LFDTSNSLEKRPTFLKRDIREVILGTWLAHFLNKKGSG
jgi:hypothetical protein